MNLAARGSLNFNLRSVSPKSFYLKGFPMEKVTLTQKIALVGAGVVTLASNAAAAVTMPTPSYTDIEAAAVVGFGIVITVALLVKAKAFLRG